MSQNVPKGNFFQIQGKTCFDDIFGLNRLMKSGVAAIVFKIF